MVCKRVLSAEVVDSLASFGEVSVCLIRLRHRLVDWVKTLLNALLAVSCTALCALEEHRLLLADLHSHNIVVVVLNEVDAIQGST